jgi:peptidoglycan/xylan/chitin deacetylase (PgdA/CDA1 family)
MRLPRDRFDYSPMRGRQPWRLPNDARIAVWTIVNVEEWDLEKPMPRQVLSAPQGASVVPDVPNWAWHEYGMRIGFWRLFEALEQRGLPAATTINAQVCRDYEPIARAMLDAGWEFMGHGVVQGAMHLLPDERASIKEAVQIIRDFTGAPPRGWLGPGLTETFDTLDYLAEAGLQYVCDWVADDQPYQIHTRSGPLLSVPYSQEMNDIAMMVIQHHNAAEWLQRGKDTFDRLYAEGTTNPRVMALCVHPYVSGVPHRIKYVEELYDYIGQHEGVWMTTGAEIADWYRTHPPA